MQEMCNKAIEEDPRYLEHVPNHLKSPDMRETVVEQNPYVLKYVPIDLITQKMCIEAVKKNS